MAAPRYALVTGASRGLGAAFAAALAARGYALILTARSADDLEAVAAPLRRSDREVHCLPADLRAGGAARVLAEAAARAWEVDLLVNNAGLGSLGPFAEAGLARELEEVDVNIRALVELTHGCLAGMRARGRGAVIHVASTAAFQPVPYLATYAATKAFVLSFSRALHGELQPEGIHVMALCPGPTRTNFFRAAGIKPLRAPMHSAEQVVEWALRGLDRRRAVVTCGWGNRIGGTLGAHLPRRWVVGALAGVMRSRWKRMV